MELIKALTIDSKKSELESEDVRLRYMMPGTAMFQIRTKEKPETFLGKPLRYSLAWDWQGSLNMFFSGFVESAVLSGEGLVRLLCRESCGKMDSIIPLALRHPNLNKVLAAYAHFTGLSFVVPQRAYATSRIPSFYTLGSGFQGLQSLGSVFSIKDYFWQAQGDGKIFVGSYEDSFWYGKAAKMPDSYFTGAAVPGTRRVSAIPPLRPGAVLNGKRVKELRLAENFMEVTC